MESFEINMCGIAFQAFEAWVFMPGDSFIFARPESQLGILQIYPSIGIPPGHKLTGDDLYDFAAGHLLESERGKPFDQKPIVDPARQFGAASYRVKRHGKSYVSRIWFLQTGDNLLLAAYAAPWKYRHDRRVFTEMNESEKMLLTARFVE